MKSIETVDLEKLKEVAKLLNEHLNEPLQVIDASKEELIKKFSEGVESLTPEQQDGLPDSVAEFYNDLYADEAEGEKTEAAGENATQGTEQTEGEQQTEGEKDKKDRSKGTKKKKAATAKKKKAATAKKKKEPKQDVPKDEFGFQIGSKNNLFAKAIKKKPLTMKEVRELDWNTSKNTHYDAFNKMKRNGQADRDDKGRMYITEKGKAEAKKK